MTLSKLIGIASDTNTNLHDVFVKAKVFASRLGNTELLNWIENEISGYSELQGNSTPDYRILRPVYRCSLISVEGHESHNCPLPKGWFNGKVGEKYLNGKARILKGIVALQHTVDSGNKEDLLIQLPVSLNSEIDKETFKYAQGTLVRKIEVRLQESSVIQLLAVIRNKLLDLLLTIEREFPNLKEIVASSPQEQKEQINQTIHIVMAKDSKTNISGTNITTSGSNNNVNANVGTGNTINSANISATSQAIADFVATVRSEMNKHEFPAKAALDKQLTELEEEAKKPEPKSSVLNTGLDVVNGLLLSVAANAWTEPILNSLISLKAIIGG